MEIKELAESLSEIERKILPHLDSSLEEIKEKSGLDSVSVQRALQFLENKEIIKISSSVEKVID